MHVFFYGSARHMIFHTGTCFCRPVLVAENIYHRRIKWIWMPAEYRVVAVYIVVYLPVLSVRLCASNKHIHVFAFCCSRNSIFWTTCPIPIPFYRKLIYVRRICRIRSPSIIYTVRINPFGYVPKINIGQSVYHMISMIVCVCISIFGHKIHTCVNLILIKPGMSLMCLPGHRLPKKIKTIIVR